MALESSARAEAFRLLLATVERAGEEARLAAELSDGELCFEDPRQAARAGLPQDLREVTKDEVGTASLPPWCTLGSTVLHKLFIRTVSN